MSERAPSGEQGPRLLRRSRDDRVLGGVAGGLGHYFGVDPVLIRIAFVILVLGAGTGILAYILAWIFIPEERAGENTGPTPRSGSITGEVVVGLILIAVGVVWLAHLALPRIFAYRYVVPSLLVAIGLVVILRGSNR